MTWHTHSITSWDDLDLRVKAKQSPGGWKMAFRGQSDCAWSLEPSLTRVLREKFLPPHDAHALEQHALEEFTEHAKYVKTHDGRVVRDLPTEKLEWWAMMQHYGAPTRLLDWSLSPYVAAYFAVCDHWDRDGLLWYFSEQAVRARTMIREMTKEIKEVESWFGVYDPQRRHDRLESQRGVFTLSDNLFDSHETIIDKWLNDGIPGRMYGNFRIPAEFKPAILHALTAMGITARSLFGDLDGLGQSIGEFIRLRAAKQPVPMSPRTVLPPKDTHASA